MAAEWRPSSSRLRSVGLAISLAAVICALYYTGAEAIWQWAVMALLLVWYVYDSIRAWRSPVQGFALRDGEWYVVIEGQSVAARLHSHHFVGQRMGVMRFVTDTRQRYPVTLLPDSLSGEEFRRLAVALG